MRLTHRVRELGSAFPPCDARVLRLAAQDHVPSAADRCPRCGGSHVLVIKKRIVTAGPRADAAGGSEPN